MIKPFYIVEWVANKEWVILEKDRVMSMNLDLLVQCMHTMQIFCWTFSVYKNKWDVSVNGILLLGIVAKSQQLGAQLRILLPFFTVYRSRYKKALTK